MDIEDDDSLPTNVVTTDAHTDPNYNIDESMYQKSLNDYQKEAFYRVYTPYFDQVQEGTHLVTQEKYDHILAILTNHRQKRNLRLIISTGSNT